MSSNWVRFLLLSYHMPRFAATDFKDRSLALAFLTPQAADGERDLHVWLNCGPEIPPPWTCACLAVYREIGLSLSNCTPARG